MTYSNDLKERAVRLYKRIKSLRQVEDLLGIGKSTIGRWVKNGNVEVTKKIEHPKTKINDRILKFIQNSIRQNPFTTAKIMIKKIKHKFKINISRSTFYSTLKKLKIKFKKVTKKIFYKSLKELKKQQQEFKKRIQFLNKKDIICIDETYFYAHANPSYGWSAKKRLTKYGKFKGKKYSVIMAISNDKILGYEIYNTNVNTKIYSDFLKNNLLDKCSNKYILKKDKIIFCERSELSEAKLALANSDNVSFHKSKNVKNLILEKNHILYIPPYSPEFNPIEELFSEIKNYYKKSFIKNIKNRIEYSVKHINNNNLQKYYKHAFV